MNRRGTESITAFLWIACGQEDSQKKAICGMNGSGRLLRVLSYLRFENGVQVRLDRIIVINGRPGPAFEEYEGYALACLDCSGGMDLEE